MVAVAAMKGQAQMTDRLHTMPGRPRILGFRPAEATSTIDMTVQAIAEVDRLTSTNEEGAHNVHRKKEQVGRSFHQTQFAQRLMA